MEKLPVLNAAEETGKNLQVAEEISPEGVGDIQEQISRFFSTVPELSQEEVNGGLVELLSTLSQHEGANDSHFLSGMLPHSVTGEALDAGNSVYARLYRALFEISTTEIYAANPQVQELVSMLSELIEQTPQLVGHVAMWQLARDYMWRRDIAGDIKWSLAAAMTRDLSSGQTAKAAEALLNHLDFEDFEQYTETAHLLEAVRQFANYAIDERFTLEVSEFVFYIDTLARIQATPNTNFLLFLRSQEMLESFRYRLRDYDAEDEEMEEPYEVPVFKLAKETYAIFDENKGLMLVPQGGTQVASNAVEQYESHMYGPEDGGEDPYAVLDEETKRWIISDEYYTERDRLYNQLLTYATLPIEDALGEIVSLDGKEKQELIFDYEYLVSKPMRALISREFGVTLSELTLREQFYFLNYLKGVTVADADAMKQFTAQHGTTGLRTFLSLERGGAELGDQIVAFGQRQEIAERVFAYYGELLDSADSAEHLVQKLTSCAEEDCIQLVEQVRENILNRAQKDLEHAVRIGNISQLEAELDRYNAHAKEYVALLQEIGEGNIETRSSQELTESDKAQMRALMQKNYQAAYPGAAHYDFREAVAASLERGFEECDTVFRLLRDGDEIVSFNRFDTIKGDDGREITYFGSFNAAPAYSGVGGVMLEATLSERLEDGRPMKAHCDPDASISAKYIEDGFVAVSFYALASKPSFEIWRSREVPDLLQSKQMSKEELLELEGKNENTHIVVRAIEPSDMYQELANGYGLTRSFARGGKSYVVFERLPDSLDTIFRDPV